MNKTQGGFTLVEMSIVLVIIGLLVAGVLAGNNLIQTVRLTRIAADINEISAATNIFVDKYYYLPGDHPEGWTIWGNECGSVVDCNGNGNGAIGNGGGNGDGPFESFVFWIQLSLSGILEKPGALPCCGSFTAGEHVPESGFGKGVGYYVIATGLFGTRSPASSNAALRISGSNNAFAPAASPADAWTVDKKMDDGNSRTGRFQAANGELGGNYVSGCITGGGQGNGPYVLDNEEVVCRMLYHLQ